MDSNELPAIGRDRINVVCWNIKHSSRIDRLKQVIDGSSPDFIFLQEVDCETARNGFIDVPSVLSCELKMYNAYAPTVSVRPMLPGMRSSYGICILSRTPISASYQYRLDNFKIYTGRSNTEPRIALVCVVMFNGKPVVLINTHLSPAGKTNKLQRAMQIIKLGNIVQMYSRVGPIVIAGDFNADPVELRTLQFWRRAGLNVAQTGQVTFRPRSADQGKYKSDTIDYIAASGWIFHSVEARVDVSVSDHSCILGTLYAEEK
ncbi:endonuclease/exonuclease/phosphatase family protein [Agrobacterium cavarae]|uniref:endonuclease/exonuclease/phosphatase family protein n=1 Tax=Agrobacterium cavarae TaxID=2528239 RepID=UPI003D01D230